MKIVYKSMNEIQILKQHPKKVLESLKLGLIERMELAVEQITVNGTIKIGDYGRIITCIYGREKWSLMAV